MQIKESIIEYLKRNNLKELDIKSILFDMDGVLFDSMPFHAQSWERCISELGIDCTRDEFYLYEGQTGFNTIAYIIKREFKREATEEEKKDIYKKKSHYFELCGEAPIMNGAPEVLYKTLQAGLTPVLVTGSGQRSLLEKLAIAFPSTFSEDKMVTAHDVKYGKPHPEPYLKGLEKTGAKINEAFIVENAPLGVRSGNSAGIFTVAVTTGPIDKDILYKEGADIVFGSMNELAENMEELIRLMSELKNS